MTSATPHRPGLQLDRSRSIARQYDQPLRLLLIRDRTGDLPWVVQTILQVMAPIELVQTRGLANALWRLGRERFDSVLLDLSTGERFAVETCRHHIADIAAIPVLDLNSDDDVGTLYPPAAAQRARERAPAPGDRRRPRDPWAQARPVRTPREPSGAEADEPASLWPPKAGKRRTPRARPAHLGGGLLGSEFGGD